MSTARLTFLYPHLFRSVRLAESATQSTKTRCRKPPGQRRQYATAFTPSARARHATFERHGKAVEPAITPDDIKLPQPPDEETQPPPTTTKTPPKVSSTIIGENYEAKGVYQEEASGKEREKSNDTPNESEIADEGVSPPSESSSQTQQQASQAQQTTSEEQIRHSGPMEVVLHMPPPGSAHHPHLSMPRYMHHFDTYTLVKQLEKDGYSKEQAITLMKGVRAMLAQNLDVAQEGLVSKRDVDNVGSSKMMTLVSS